MLNVQLTPEQVQLLGNWQVSIHSYHQLNAVLQSFANDYNELLRLEKVVICFGAPIGCFASHLQLVKDRVHATTQIRDLIYNLLNTPFNLSS